MVSLSIICKVVLFSIFQVLLVLINVFGVANDPLDETTRKAEFSADD